MALRHGFFFVLDKRAHWGGTLISASLGYWDRTLPPLNEAATEAEMPYVHRTQFGLEGFAQGRIRTAKAHANY